MIVGEPPPSAPTVPCNSFLPILDQLRPRKDISNSERPGPVASDAMLVNRMIWRVAARLEAGDATQTWLWGSEAPNTLPPLKSWRARPSQKLSKWKPAPCIVGVFRGSTLRNWLRTPGSSGFVPAAPANAAIGSLMAARHAVGFTALAQSAAVSRRSGATALTPLASATNDPTGAMSLKMPQWTPI